MSMEEHFSGPLLKLERADKHIEDLNQIFKEHIERSVKRFENVLPQDGETASFPRHTPTILGDSLHNLRAALDHAFYICCKINDAKLGRWTKFPFGATRDDVRNFLQGAIKSGRGPAKAVSDAILSEIQPYTGGTLRLYGLHQLDITDKHTTMIPTDRLVQNLDVSYTTPSGRAGPSLQGFTFVLKHPKGEVISVPPGYRGTLRNRPEDTFKIVFPDGQPFSGENVLDTVLQLRKSTEVALSILAGQLS